MKLPRDFRDIGHCQSPSPRRSPAGLLYLDRAVKARPLAGGRCRPASGAIHSEDFDPLLRYAINLVLGSSRFLLASLPGPRPLNDCPGRLSRAEPFLAQRAGIFGHCTDTKRKLICALEALGFELPTPRFVVCRPDNAVGRSAQPGNRRAIMSAPMRQHRRNGPVTPPSARFRIPGLPLDCLQRAYSASILCQCKQECHRRPPSTCLISLRTLERAMGFEPTTPTLARLCSTPELHPHAPAARPGGHW